MLNLEGLFKISQVDFHSSIFGKLFFRGELDTEDIFG